MVQNSPQMEKKNVKRTASRNMPQIRIAEGEEIDTLVPDLTGVAKE